MSDPKTKQELFNLYDDYAHNRLTRSEFMQKLSLYAVGGVTLTSLMSFLMPEYNEGVKTKNDDPRIETKYITYTSPKGGGSIKGLLCIPKGEAKKPGGVVVVHENRGLNPYIEDVARSAAIAGFVALAPDALSPLGGYPGNDDDGRTLQAKRNRDEMLEDFIAAFDYLRNNENCNGKVGVVGFCFGGWISNMMAARVPDLKAAVPYYGGQAPASEVSNIKAPLQLHYAELDTRVNEGWPAYEKELKEKQKEFTVYFYPKANHGFHNYSTPRFDKEAADLAWERTIAFFKEKLA